MFQILVSSAHGVLEPALSLSVPRLPLALLPPSLVSDMRAYVMMQSYMALSTDGASLNGVTLATRMKDIAMDDREE